MSDLSTLLSSTERYIIAQNKVKTSQRPSITSFQLKPNTTASNGHLGQYYQVEMTIKEENGKEEKCKFFMKSLPNGWQNELLEATGIFQKEVNFYKDLCGTFRKFLTTDVFPECFLAVPGKIVLTDAYTEGYRSAKDATQPLDYEHAKLSLTALAVMHAGSIIYEEKTGKKVGEDFPDAAREAQYQEGFQCMGALKAGGESIAALAPHLDTDLGRDPAAVALLQEHAGSWMKKLGYYYAGDPSHRKVICHGDTTPANFLYRYNSQGKPVSAMLIDFQLTRLSSPASDIYTFMYMSMSMDDLRKYRRTLLDEYYVALGREMRNCGLDPEKIYPKKEFLETCIYYQITGIIYSLVYFPLTRVRPEAKHKALNTKEKAAKFFFEDRKQHTIDCYKSDPILRKSLNGVIEDLYENFIKTKRGLTEFIH